MLLIQLTGNYCYFNLLGIALCLLLLDDNALLPVFKTLWPGMALRSVPAPAACEFAGGAAAVVLLSLSLAPMFRLFRFELQRPRALSKCFDWFEPFRLVNSYGLFSVMTTERPEIIIEGSVDGATWEEYEFKWKPGDVRRPPRFVAPHQPRLDWQLWFAALGFFGNHAWVGRLLLRLLEGSPEVLGLLKKNPFAAAPPRYVRAVIYQYRFSTRQERRQSGTWWVRERRGNYTPTMELPLSGQFDSEDDME